MKHHRPETRGDLKEKLMSGTTCEINERDTMTVIMLKGWLEFDEFSIQPSDNEGYVLLVPDQRRAAIIELEPEEETFACIHSMKTADKWKTALCVKCGKRWTADNNKAG